MTGSNSSTLPAKRTGRDLDAATGAPKRTTEYLIKDTDLRLVAIHVREDLADGEKVVWWKQPDGTRGLDGIRLADLPLYGAETIGDLDEEELIVLTEGEKARDALHVVGIPAVGTVTGASCTPGPAALEALRGRTVCLWPDADDPGHKHMQRIAEALQGVAAAVLVYTWPETPEEA